MQKRHSTFLLICVASTLHAQTCFFSADFEDGSIPSDWSNTSVIIVSNGETTDAWTVGNSEQANSGGFFSVPDVPIGNRFAMANDDAAPCDCIMDQVFLTTPALDLSARSHVAMRCRVFHEMTLGGGATKVEASTNGADWTMVDSVEAVSGVWQDVYIDLAAFDGAPALQLRFSWSDGGEWASGVAIDDVCVSERRTHDLAIVNAHVNDPSASPFDMATRTLPYTRLPLGQASGLVGTVVVENRGTVPLNDITAGASVTLNSAGIGNGTGGSLATLEPGERAIISITDLPAAGEAGAMSIDFTADYSGAADEDPSNNQISVPLRITDSGWEGGYGAMALDDGSAQGNLGSELGFIAANRFELIADATAFGASAVLGTDSQLGEEVRAILMDGNFAFVDTSNRHVITQEDIDLAWGSGAILLPFPDMPSLAPGDYFVGLQRLSGSGRVSVSTSGNCTPGTAALMEGITFDITWTTAVPMVRLHLDALGVGLTHAPERLGTTVQVFPHPLSGEGYLLTGEDVAGPLRIRVFESTGRLVKETVALAFDARRIAMNVDDLPAGAYVLEAGFNGRRQSIPLIVAR